MRINEIFTLVAKLSHEKKYITSKLFHIIGISGNQLSKAVFKKQKKSNKSVQFKNNIHRRRKKSSW